MNSRSRILRIISKKTEQMFLSLYHNKGKSMSHPLPLGLAQWLQFSANLRFHNFICRHCKRCKSRQTAASSAGKQFVIISPRWFITLEHEQPFFLILTVLLINLLRFNKNFFKVQGRNSYNKSGSTFFRMVKLHQQSWLQRSWFSASYSRNHPWL